MVGCDGVHWKPSESRKIKPTWLDQSGAGARNSLPDDEASPAVLWKHTC